MLLRSQNGRQRIFHVTTKRHSPIHALSSSAVSDAVFRAGGGAPGDALQHSALVFLLAAQTFDLRSLSSEAWELALHSPCDRSIEEVCIDTPSHAHVRVS